MSQPAQTDCGSTPVELSNQLLRNERLTDDLYKAALENVNDERLSYRLTSIRLNHLEAILLLKRLILQLDGEPSSEIGESEEGQRIRELRRGDSYDEEVVRLLLEMERSRQEKGRKVAERLADVEEARQLLEEEILVRSESNQRVLESILAAWDAEARRKNAAKRSESGGSQGLVFGDNDAPGFSVI